MSTYDEENKQKSPLENPAVRHGIGLFGAAMITVVAFLYLEGTLRTIALVIAVLDAFVTPKILEAAVEQEDPPESLAEMLR